jgi:tetratricopeptide (TPR) repeat protein
LAACNATVEKAIEYETDILLKEAVDKAKNALTDASAAMSFEYESRMNFYGKMKDKPNYISTLNAYARSIDKKDFATAKRIIDNAQSNFSSDRDANQAVSKLAEALYKEDSSFENLFLYTNILDKAGQKSKALKTISKAMKAAEKSGEGVEQLQSLYKLMEER